VHSRRYRQRHIDRAKLPGTFVVEGTIHAERFIPVHLRDALAIQIHQQLFAADLAKRAEVAHVAEVHGKHFERVFAIRRERMIDLGAATRAERKACDVIVLRGVFRDSVGHLRWRCHRTDGEAADFRGGREIRFEQRGGECQCAGLVVEAAAGVIRRQKLRGIELERQQVAHGVRVFGAVQAMQLRHVQVGLRLAVYRPLKIIGERLHGGEIGALLAGRRHHAGAQLLQYFLRVFRVIQRVRGVEHLDLHASCIVGVVVAGDAIVVEQLPLLGGRHLTGGNAHSG
jgi:hypothetical protein